MHVLVDIMIKLIQVVLHYILNKQNIHISKLTNVIINLQQIH